MHVISEATTGECFDQYIEAAKEKRNPPLSREDMLTQCASYALEMLSYGGLYTHVFGALITDDCLELLYYDRSIPVQSKPLNFIQDPTALVVMLYGMLKLTHCEWCYVRAIKPSLAPALLPAMTQTRRHKPFALEPTPIKTFHGAQLELKNGKVLELNELVFHQHTLIGRTCVIRAKVKEPDSDDVCAGKSIIVKFSFTPDTRIPEGEMLRDIVEVVEKNGEDWVLNHLLEVLHYERFRRMTWTCRHAF
jgi:hypothetical protein